MSHSSSVSPAFAAMTSNTNITAAVIAVFDRCCYLQLAGQPEIALLCLGQISIRPGSINLPVDDGQWQFFRQCLQTGDVATIRQRRLLLAGVSVNLADIETWQSPGIATLCRTSPRMIRSRLTMLGEHAPTDSLFQVLVTEKSSTAAIPGTASLASAIRAYFVSVVSELKKELLCTLLTGASAQDDSVTAFGSAPHLLGAGAGLTPAGDDLLAGVMLALRYFGQPAAAIQLFREIKPHLPARTNVISAALLAEAAEGRASLPLFDIFAQLGNPADAFQARALAASIGEIGHSSGWDLLAGVALVVQVLQNILEAPETLVPPTTRQSMHA